MNGFDKLFTLIKERYEDYEPDFDQSESDALDMSSYSDQDDFVPERVPGTKLIQYSYKRVEMAILRALDMQKKALMIYGASGIGKSQMINNLCKNVVAPDKGLTFVNWNDMPKEKLMEVVDDPEWIKTHYMFIDIRAAELEPIDLRGIDMPTSKLPYLDPKTPLWIWYVSRPESRGVVFFDEFNQAMEQVFNAMYGVILDRAAGNVRFSKNWGIIAAGNIGVTHTTITDLPPALTNRFDTIYLVADPKEWAEWATGKNERGFSRIEPDVVSYALSDPARTFLVEAEAGDAQSVPNPRNLEAFSDTYRYIRHVYSNRDRLEQKIQQRGSWITGNFFADIRDTATATCGYEWSEGFVQFIKIYSKINWEDLYKNATKYASEDLEQVYAYIYYVAKKTVGVLGYGTPLNAKLRENITNMVNKKPFDQGVIDEAAKFAQQFAAITSYLIYNVKDIKTKGVQNDKSDPALAKKIEQEVDGDGEHIATLINIIQSMDPAYDTNRPDLKDKGPFERNKISALHMLLAIISSQHKGNEEMTLLYKILMKVQKTFK